MFLVVSVTFASDLTFPMILITPLPCVWEEIQEAWDPLLIQIFLYTNRDITPFEYEVSSSLSDKA